MIVLIGWVIEFLEEKAFHIFTEVWWLYTTD